MAALAASGPSGRAAARETLRSTAREEAELLAKAGEARYRLARLRSGRGDLDGDLERAVRALDEARSLDPANLRALAYLGLAYFEAAKRPAPGGTGGVDFDPGAFASAREPLEELFRLAGRFADPQTRVILKEVVRTLDEALRRPASDPAPGNAAASTWWTSWRERVAPAAKATPPARDVLTLIEALRGSPFAWEREDAAEKLAERKHVPPEAVEALSLALREDASPWVRAAAAKALATLKADGWEVRLAEALRNDESVWVRRTCADRLWSIPLEVIPKTPPQVRESLSAALRSDTPAVAAVAAKALGRFAGTEDLLIEALESTSTLVRDAAAYRLGSGEDRVVRRVAELLRSDRPEVRATALRALPPASRGAVPCPDDVIDAMAGLLDDTDCTVRAMAALKFSDRYAPVNKVRAKLRELMRDNSPLVRFAAAGTLFWRSKDKEMQKVLESLVGSVAPVPWSTAWEGVRQPVTVGEAAREVLQQNLGPTYEIKLP